MLREFSLEVRIISAFWFAKSSTFLVKNQRDGLLVQVTKNLLYLRLS